MLTAEASAGMLVQTSEAWNQDQPSSQIVFDDAVLERTKRSAGHNPYLIVRVDGALMENHGDITDPRLIEFIKQLILISSRDHEQK